LVPGTPEYCSVVGSDVWRPTSPPITSLWVTPQSLNRPEKSAWSSRKLSVENWPRIVRVMVMLESGVSGAMIGPMPGSVILNEREYHA